MKFTLQSLVFVLILGTVQADVLQINPLQKVVQLLSDLEEKIKADGEKEAAVYAEYSAWCTNENREMGFSSQTATSEIEDLSATIEKATTDVSTAISKTGNLADSIATDEHDLKAATTIRTTELSDFNAVEAELMDTVDTLDRAINALGRSKSTLLQTKISGQDTQHLIQALSIVLDAVSVSTRDKKKLIALTQNAVTNDEDGLNAPAAATYESHSGNIIDVLSDLREKAFTQLTEARKAEVNAKHNVLMLKQSLDDQIRANTNEMTEWKGLTAASTRTKASAEKDLAATKKDLAATQKALSELQSSCDSAAVDNVASTKSRKEELEALAAARTVINEKTQGAEPVVYGSFLQLKFHNKHWTQLAGIEVVTLLRQLAQKTTSSALAQLANRVGAVMQGGVGIRDDRFGKVKGMIADLLNKLEEEQGADVAHKAYCDKETAQTNEKMESLNHGVNKLTAQVDKQKAKSKMLKGETSELLRELAELAKSQAEMDKVRASEHGVFTQTKKDLELGLEGIRSALKILRDYYGSAGLLQQPGTHEKSGDSVTGILGMLEVIQSDLGKSLAECVNKEDSSSIDYEKLSQSNRVTEAAKQQDVKYKTSEATALDSSTAQLTSDLQNTQTELDAVLEYMKSINAACVVKPETYEARRTRREAEIAGLKEALSILEDQVGLLQRRDTSLRGTHVKRH